MRYSFYLHDLFYDVGHANVTVDMINNLPKDNNNHYHFIVFTADKKEKLFPKLDQQVTYHHVPFPNIPIAFVKIIFFHLYTFFYSAFVDKSERKISLGIANINCDVSIIHFIHSQWEEYYFKFIKMSKVKLVYKKIFYFYLRVCENLMFKFSKPRLITVSDFMKDYIQENFQYESENITSIHSGFDQSRFSDKANFLSHKELLEKYPVLRKIDFSMPVCLFVGAFERKGLTVLLQRWEEAENAPQLLVIGKSESGFEINGLSDKLFHIPHVKEIDQIFELSDYFLFPTIYEPFGMVLIEAAMKGLKIISTRKNVGATEVIENLAEVEIYKDTKNFALPKSFSKLSLEDRKQLIDIRRKNLENFEWKSISEKYNQILSKPL